MSVPIQITGKNLELTEPLKQDVNAKFQKLGKHFPKLMEIHVTLSVERIDHREQHKAKAHVILPKGNIVAEESSDDMYASIDVLIDKLNTQIIKHKEKIKGASGDTLF